MSNVAKMKEKFQGKGGVTPEQHKILIKTMKEKEDQAVNIAKARAARYNLTLRSATLQSSISNSNNNNSNTTSTSSNASSASKTPVKGTTSDDFKKKTDNVQETPRQYTLKSVKVTVQAQNTVADALNHKRSPSVAKKVVEVVAKTVDKVATTEDQAIKKKSIVANSKRAVSIVVPKDASPDIEIATVSEAWANVAQVVESEIAAEDAAAEAIAAESSGTSATATSSGENLSTDAGSSSSSSVVAPPAEELVLLEVKAENSETVAIEVHENVVAVLEEAKVEVTPKIVESILTEDSKAAVGQEFEMSDLKKAIEQDDHHAINHAVVKEFLEVHAPEKVQEVPALLEEFKGKESELMEKLAEEHPDPVEKIEAEAMEALNIDDKNILDQHLEDVESQLKAEEAKVHEMSEDEKIAYEAKNAAIAQHSEHKDRMLKQQLNIYSAGGTGGARNIVMGGRGRGKGKKKSEDSTGRAATEFIVSGVNNGGQWEVNPDDKS